MEKSGSRNGFFINCSKGALIGTAAGTALVALFAFILLKQWLGPESVTYINLGVKAVSGAVAALIAVRSAGERRPIVGAAAGLLCMLLSFVVFSLISGEFAFDTALLTDLVICAAIGAVVGMLENLREQQA